MYLRRYDILVVMCAICLLMSCGDSSDTMPDSGPDTPQDSSTAVKECALGFSASLAADGSGVTEPMGSRSTRAVGDGEFGLDDSDPNKELKASGFGVYCWYTEDRYFSTPGSATYLLMRNQKVEYDEALAEPWHYEPAKYWPLESGHQLTFRAYAPYVSYSLVERTSGSYLTYVSGMPLLPVVVSELDYQNGTQHDPLWGTGRLVQGDGDTNPGEYYPEPDPSAPDQSKSKLYGQLYNDITYKMSGDYRLANDSRDGIIDWYFHHGMSCLMPTLKIVKDPGCDKVTITRIVIEPLYKQGLLDISSPTGDSSEKPWWYDCSGNMTVDLGATCLAASPLDITIDTDPAKESGPVALLSKGLLIIPRTYDALTPMTVKIYYKVDDDTEEQEAAGKITSMDFKGNTKYTLGLTLTPETRGVQIEIVQSAFTAWREGDSGDHIVYNW